MGHYRHHEQQRPRGHVHKGLAQPDHPSGEGVSREGPEAVD